MHKILLIVKREYLTRVRKKSFLVMSILGPLLFAMLMIIPIWLATRESDKSDKKIIHIVDETGIFENSLPDNVSMPVHFTDKSLDEARGELAKGEIYAILHIPNLDFEDPTGIKLYSESNPSFDVILPIERAISRIIKNQKIDASGVDREVLKKLDTNVSIQTINVSKGYEQVSNTAVATAVGYIASLLIYFFILFYGVQIMRGVIEEKSNRIVEVIISSVRPFHLMLGKIMGIGAVGLTQFTLWAVLTMLIYTGVLAYFGLSQADMAGMENMAGAGMAGGAESAQMVQDVLNAVNTINIPLILICFLLYFLGAYLLYGSLFAAIGSAADSDSDAQQFQLPVTIPLIFSIIVLGAVLKDPDGSLAFWMSMIPLSSPIVMMMRIPFGVPTWQLLLSITFLSAGFIFTTWLASRIYRIGILMHGSKVNYRILFKWLFMKS
ncbi:MAG: ABC transporter permease [Cyclobacteriaceae bacterium]